MNKTIISMALTTFLGAFSASAFANYSFNFDGVASCTSANNSIVNPYSDVTFLSGFVTADLDSNGFEILDMNNQTIPGFTHWETYPDSDIRVRDPQFYGAGVAPSGTNSLDAKFDQVFIKFSAAQDVTSFSVQLDNSTLGFTNANLFFVDSFGKALSTFAFDQSQSGGIVATGVVNNVSGIILSSGKLYDNINIAAVAVAAVPEPESYALFLAGLAVVGVVSRRKKG